MNRGPGRARRSAGPRRQDDAGMVTAEFAVALPALVLAAATAIGGVVAMTDELRCADASATAARLAARGEPTAVVRSVALRAAPRGASLVISTSGGVVTATVTDRIGGPGVLGRLPALTVRQHSVAALEPGAGAGAQ
jgi:Flp pilus assembly protein TadG